MLRVKGTAPCGCWIAILVTNLLLGGWSVGYLLASLVAVHIGLGWAMLIGLFVGQFTVPAAIVCWLLRCAGVHVPFFG